MTKHPRGNITILVIFMLITASVIGLLVMTYVRNMLQVSNNFFVYNKAYYLAEGGLELELTKMQQRGIGFEDTVNLNDLYNCYAGNKGRQRGSQLCTGSGSIVAQGELMTRSFDATSCNEKNNYDIQGGDAIGFPLFIEEGVSANDVFAEDINYQDNFVNNFSVDFLATNASSSKEIGVGLVKLQKKGDLRDLPEEGSFSRVYTAPYQDQTINTLDFPFDQDDINNGEELYYLVIFNPQSAADSLQFCLEAQSPSSLALTQVGAKSFATFRGVSVGLEARRTIELPGFVFSTVVESAR